MYVKVLVHRVKGTNTAKQKLSHSSLDFTIGMFENEKSVTKKADIYYFKTTTNNIDYQRIEVTARLLQYKMASH